MDYVIITTDALAAEYQRLADWKTEKGVPTVVRTVEWIKAHARNGVDLPETIRFFVRDAYAKWGITYVLLGGDTDILPPRYGVEPVLPRAATRFPRTCTSRVWTVRGTTTTTSTGERGST